MAKSLEGSLITKIIETGDLRTPIRNKITDKFFEDDLHREVYGWLCDKYQTHGLVPSLKLLQREYSDFEPTDTDDDMILIIEQFKREHLYNDMSRVTKKIVDMTLEDPEEGFAQLKTLTGELILKHSNGRDVDFTKETKSLWKEYVRAKNGEGRVQNPWPWDYANRITRGKQNGDFYALYAREKAMKTFLMLYCANHSHEEGGITPGFAACEMSEQQIMRRLAGLRAKVPFAALRAGTMSSKEEKRYKLKLEEIRDAPPFMIFKPSETGVAALTEMRAKVEEYQLEELYVDGLSFLMDDETHRSFGVLTRGLKSLADSCRIPVTATSHANRNRAGTDSTMDVAFGDWLSRVCDGLFKITRNPEHKENKELLITMPALRDAEGGTFTINAIPCTDFSQKHVMEDEEADDETEAESDITS